MMQVGDIVFYKGNGWISKLIAKVSDSKYTHVAIAVDEHRVLEANRFIKSRIVHLDLDSEIHSIYRIPDLTAFQLTNISSNIQVYKGYPYDYTQIVKWFLQLVFNYELPFVNKANKLFCSELVDYVLYEAGIPRKGTYPLGDVVPHMLIDSYGMEKIC